MEAQVKKKERERKNKRGSEWHLPAAPETMPAASFWMGVGAPGPSEDTRWIQFLTGSYKPNRMELRGQSVKLVSDTFSIVLSVSEGLEKDFDEWSKKVDSISD